MAGGSLISRLYDFINGMTVEDYHLDGELDLIHEWINGKLGNLNIAADANIAGSKLAVGSTPLDRLASAVYTAAQIDVLVAGAALGQVPDRSVDGTKLKLATVGADEVKAEIALASSVVAVAGDLTTHQNDANAHTKVFTHSHGYTWLGDVIQTSGDVGYFPPFYIGLATGETAVLTKARYRINTGSTSVTVTVLVNSVVKATLTVNNTVAATSDFADVTLANGDEVTIAVTGVTGAAKNLSVTLFVEHTQ